MGEECSVFSVQCSVFSGWWLVAGGWWLVAGCPRLSGVHSNEQSRTCDLLNTEN